MIEELQWNVLGSYWNRTHDLRSISRTNRLRDLCRSLPSAGLCIESLQANCEYSHRHRETRQSRWWCYWCCARRMETRKVASLSLRVDVISTVACWWWGLHNLRRYFRGVVSWSSHFARQCCCNTRDNLHWLMLYCCWAASDLSARPSYRHYQIPFWSPARFRCCQRHLLADLKLADEYLASTEAEFLWMLLSTVDSLKAVELSMKHLLSPDSRLCCWEVLLSFR